MTQEAQLPLHHSPESAPSRDPLLMVLTGVVSMLLWLALAGQLFFVVPQVARAFGEFRMKLPWLTELVIAESLWAVPVMAVATLVVCIAFAKRSNWPWAFLLILLPLIINGIVGASLFIPYLEMLDALQGGGKK